MPKFGTALLLCLLFASCASAQDQMSERLSEERLADVEPGAYAAGKIAFTIDRYPQGKFLLHFNGEPEVFVVYSGRASMGGRVLLYDSGATALRVAGWGGMTLYTDADPGGVPAERTGNSAPPSLPQVSLSEMQSAAEDEAVHLAYSRRLHLTFAADWNALAGDPRLRGLCFDALQNTERGLERFAANDKARDAFTKKIDQVRIALGNKPVMFLSGRTLNVTFNGQTGYAGRASSRGISRALGQLLSVPAPN